MENTFTENSAGLVEIVNRQRKFELNSAEFHKFAELAAEAVPAANGKSLTVAFVSNRKMRELNNEFRGKNSTTDVLSFPALSDEDDFSDESYLGDIVISVEQAVEQSAENDLSLELEIKQLILHGVLHLCGFDHEIDDGEMNQLEIELREKLEIAD